MPRKARTDRLPSLSDEPSYYDISILKRPVWKWEIAGYFFMGGLSAGAYILSRVADRFGNGQEGGHQELARTGALTAFIAALPCAPLLIMDLGDPKLFHHMLRVWKPSTPMNVGSWTLTAYSGAATAAVLRQYLKGRPRSERRKLGRLTDAALLVVSDVAGVPLAIMLAGYTGVLLSCTANPLWCKNNWLAPLFSASSIASGADAVSLALDGRDLLRLASVRKAGISETSHRALERVSTGAHLVEAVTLRGFLHQAGEKADTLTRGKMKRWLWISIGGLIASELLKLLPVQGKAKRWTRMAAATAGLVSVFALRWGMVYGGKEAAADPHTARLASRPEPSNGNVSHDV